LFVDLNHSPQLVLLVDASVHLVEGGGAVRGLNDGHLGRQPGSTSSHGVLRPLGLDLRSLIARDQLFDRVGLEIVNKVCVYDHFLHIAH
jgi:hypothetical protein